LETDSRSGWIAKRFHPERSGPLEPADVVQQAEAGKNGGFAGPPFVEAGQRLQALAALHPFQDGYVGTLALQAAGMFGDGKSALQLFDMVIPLTGGGPFEQTNTMVSFMYNFGITRMRVGYGSAVGVVLFMVCVTFALFYQRFLMRDE
jgi:hypothetical protein